MLETYQGLSLLPGAAGDAERAYQADPPLPGEMPAETDARQQSAAQTGQRAFVATQRLKAGDFARRDMPAFTDFSTGEVKPVTDAAGQPLTGFDKANKIAWDSTGQPQKISYDEKGPVLSNPFEGIPPITDKRGDKYLVAPGLPWQHVGVDTDVKAANLVKEQDRAVADASAAMGRKLTIEERQAHRDEVAFHHGDKEFAQNFGPIDYENPDDSRKALESSFDEQYKAPEATKTGWFDKTLTPEAQQVRAQIDQSRAKALQKFDSLLSTRQAIANRRAVMDQVAQRRDQLESGRADRALARSSVIPGLDDSQDAQASQGPIGTASSQEEVQTQRQSQPEATGGSSPLSTVIPGLTEAQKKSSEVDPREHLAAAEAGQKPYRFDQKNGLQFTPDKLSEGLDQAVKDGVVDKDWADQHAESFKVAQDKYAALQKAAGSAQVVKALLHGGGMGAAFLAAAGPGAAIGAEIGSALGPIGAGVGTVLGGLSAGSLASFAAHKGLEKLGEYSDAIKSLNASAELHPIADASGELVAFASSAPRALGKLLRAGAIAGGGVEGAKVIAGQLAKGAAGGLAFEAIARPAFDAARYVAADQLGIQHDELQAPTVNSLATNVALGLLTAGHAIEFRDYNAKQLASILTRAKVRSDAGIPLDAEVPVPEMVAAYKARGVDLQSSNVAEMAAPLSREEIGLHQKLAEQTQQMEQAGAFKNAGVKFESAEQAVIPGLRKGSGTNIASAVIKAEPLGEAPAEAVPPAIEGPVAPGEKPATGRVVEPTSPAAPSAEPLSAVASEAEAKAAPIAATPAQTTGAPEGLSGTKTGAVASSPDPTEPAPAPQGQPTMITRQMEADLKGRGLSEEQIARITPKDAVELLAKPAETPTYYNSTLFGNPSKGRVPFEKSATLGVPREQMPQVRSEHRGALANFLKARGMDWQEADVSPTSLKPTQADYEQSRVEKAASMAGEPDQRRILISSDNRVIDGHHQWLAQLRDHPEKPIPALRIDAPAKDILKQIHEFPSAGMEKAPSLPTAKAAPTSSVIPGLDIPLHEESRISPQPQPPTSQSAPESRDAASAEPKPSTPKSKGPEQQLPTTQEKKVPSPVATPEPIAKQESPALTKLRSKLEEKQSELQAAHDYADSLGRHDSEEDRQDAKDEIRTIGAEVSALKRDIAKEEQAAPAAPTGAIPGLSETAKTAKVEPAPKAAKVKPAAAKPAQKEPVKPEAEKPARTPMMTQYASVKETLPKGTILLMRLGDFYEAFDEDAKTVGSALKVAVTKRKDVPMAGIPHHAAESYIRKLIDAGHKVALMERMEGGEPKVEKVEREVTHVEGLGKPESSAIPLNSTVRIGKRLDVWTVKRAIEQTPAEKANGEQFYEIENEKGETKDDVQAKDMQVVNRRDPAEVAAEKAKAKENETKLDQRVANAGMDPSKLPDRKSKLAALKRAKDKGIRESITPAFSPKLRAAYDALVQKDRWRFPAVSIGELAKESGIPLADLKAQLYALHKAGKVVLSIGDWSLSSPTTRAGMIDVNGERMTQVRPIDEMLESRTPPPPVTFNASNGDRIIITPSAREPGKYQATYLLSDDEPAGHLTAGSMEEAIRRVNARDKDIFGTHTPKFTQVEHGTFTKHHEAIKETVEKLKQQFPGVEVTVLHNEAEAPELTGRIKRHATHEGLTDTSNGRVYLFTDHIGSPERAVEVFAHEVVGHYGVEKLIGDAEFQQIAKLVLSEAPVAARNIARLYVKRNANGTEKAFAEMSDAEKATIAREYVARLAEQPSINPSLWQRLMAWLRKALRKLGLRKDWSNAELRDLIRRAKRVVQEPASKAVGKGGVEASARDQVNTPAFKKWFGASKVVDEQGSPLRVYHGTPQDIKSFDPKRLGNATGAPSAKRGFFFVNDPEVASEYGLLGGFRDGTFRSEYTGFDYRLEQLKELQTLTRKSGPGIFDSPMSGARHYYAINRVDVDYPVKKMIKAMEAGASFSDAMAEHGTGEVAEIFGERDSLKWTDQGQGGNVIPVYLAIQNPLVHDFKGDEYRERTYNDLLKQALDEGRDGAIFRNTFDHLGEKKEGGVPHDVYVAFRPSQIKSATGNSGAFDPENPDMRASMPSDPEPVQVGLALLDIDTPVVTDLADIKGYPDAESAVLVDKAGVHHYDLTGEKPERVASAKATGDQAAIDALTDGDIPKVRNLEELDREDYPDAKRALIVKPSVGRLELVDIATEEPVASARLAEPDTGIRESLVSDAKDRLEKFAAPGLEMGRDAKAGIQSLLMPTAKSPEHLQAAEVLGSKLGPMNQRQESVAHALKKERHEFVKLGVNREGLPIDQNAGIKFMSNASTGQPQAPEFQGYAAKREEEYGKRQELLAQADAPMQNIREDYFPGVWTGESRRAFNLAMQDAKEGGIIPEGVGVNDATADQKAWVKARVDKLLEEGKGSDTDALGYLTKTPLKGKQSFRKQKVFDEDIATAFAFGLRAVSNNPVDIDMLKWAEMDRNIMANQALQQWKQEGKLKTISATGKVPDGWQKVNDRYGTVYGPRKIEVRASNSRLVDKDTGESITLAEAGLDELPPEGTTLKVRVPGLMVIGHRIVPNAVGDILNNYLSSSLYNNRYFGKIFTGWMGLANALNQAQLGVGSAFHAGFTTAEAQISAGANLVKDVFGILRGNRHFGHLMGSVRNLGTASFETAMTGDKVLNAWRNPDGTIDPKIAQIVRAVELAGGGFTMERGLQTDQASQAVSDWYNGKKLTAAMRSPVAAVEMMARPIMSYLVPRQKAGVFAHMASRIIEQNPDKTLEELAPEFRQAWNRIDARLGQVRYDRLFINNTAKNVVQGLVRAPGWSGGTIAELGGAVKDTYGFFREWAKTGKLPQDIPDRVAYTMSLLITVALANALLTYLFTGKKAEGLDYLAFQTGGKDEQGRPERFVLPTYMKDLLAYGKEPLTTLANKAHPLLSVFGDLIRNKDYYGVEIRHQDDNAIKQAMQAGGYVAKAFTPFWIRGVQKEQERKSGPLRQALPLIGVMPAPKKMTQTPAERLADEYARDMIPAGARTQEQADASKAKYALVQQLRQGTQPDWQKEIAAGHITSKDIAKIRERALLTPLQYSAKKLSADKAQAVYARANPAERAQLRNIVQQKGVKKSTLPQYSGIGS